MEKHIDLFEVAKAFLVSNDPRARAPSLDAMCKFLFGYQRRLPIRGSDIPDLYERWQGGDEGARRTIVEHCLEDLEMTRMVLERLRPYLDIYVAGVG